MTLYHICEKLINDEIIDFFSDGRETYDNVQVMLRYNKEGLLGNFGSTLSNEREGFFFKIKGSYPWFVKDTNPGRGICVVIFLAENPADNAEVISPDHFL